MKRWIFQFFVLKLSCPALHNFFTANIMLLETHVTGNTHEHDS